MTQRRLIPSETLKVVEIVDAPLSDNTPAVSIGDFYAYMPAHSYICAPSRDLWPAASVNSRLPPVETGGGRPVPAASWLDANAAVEQMTWAPGEPMLIKDRLVSDGGWIKRPGWSVFNLYRPATLVPRAGDVKPWLDLVRRVFPSEAEHIIRWLASRVQRPHVKINHALVLGGRPGIGKDTILEPVKQAIGPWNFADVSPKQILGRFNGFAKSVILRVNEARDLGEFDRFAFFDHTKALIASPPGVVMVDIPHRFEDCGYVAVRNPGDAGGRWKLGGRRHTIYGKADLTERDRLAAAIKLAGAR